MKCVNLNNEIVKIPGAHFLYSNNLKQDKNFCEHQNRKHWRQWRMRQLTLEGRITVFKSLAVSKFIHLSLITNSIIIQLIFCIKYGKTLFDKGKRQKRSNGYEKAIMKNVDLRNKITSMECSWVKRLFEDDFLDWKVIPLFLIGKHLGKNFKLHNNIDINNDLLLKFLSFYQHTFITIKPTAKPTLPSIIFSEFNWFNLNTKAGPSKKMFYLLQ